ncbi:type III-B CRISPR module RAMP protein Cmr1 [Endozoicomonas acroporae]|uniref:type III-B CRISPR module RAMP protein Cmr1 n=1 Tax=Endozoicomonas acroporae TaxID=1701104 RepID=UPI003D7A8D34
MTTILLAQRLSPLIARYQISTPMFLGDASSDECAEKIRPSSLKGALRFWWRALNWGRVYSSCGKNTDTALQQLHREEGVLFGLAAKTNGKEKVGGQSAFRLRIRDDQSKTGKEPVRGIPYLLGQGLTGKNKESHYLESGSDFTVCCYPSPQMSSEQSEQLEQALLCLGMLGGLGARSRKGLGSLSIQELSGGRLAAPENRGEYIEVIQNLLKSVCVDLAVNEPPYSALSALSRIDISSFQKSPAELLTEYNNTLHEYRTWQTEKPNFKDDHDWAYNVANGKPINTLPQRTVFGLPHNYFLSKARQKVDVNASTGRRATPLIAHVHLFKDGNTLLVQALLRSTFLHRESAVNISSKRNRKALPGEVDWCVIERFMNQFGQRETIHG